MIYLIPDWEQEDDLEYNRMLNIAKLFHENAIDYKIILVNSLPFVRYKSLDFHFSGDYLRVYDYLQNVSISEGNPISLEDLAFPEELERVYTFIGVLLYYEGEVSSEVRYNDYGYVSRVKYYLNNETIIDFWDDRGFLSQREHYNKEKALTLREYFNECGDKTLEESLGESSLVTVTDAGNLNLEKRQYASMNEVIAEAVTRLISQREAKNQERHYVLIEHSEKIVKLADVLNFQEDIIDILDGDLDLQTLEEESLTALLNNRRPMITDAFNKRQEILALRYQRDIQDVGDVLVVPMYNTTLELGNSNSIAYLIIYVKMGALDDFRLTADREIVERIIDTEDYSVILEVNSAEDKDHLSQIHKEMIDKHFKIDSQSSDYKKVAHYLEAKEAKKLFDTDEKAVKDIKKSAAWKYLVGAANAYRRIKYRINPHLKLIAQDLSTARIYVNISEANNLQIQAQAISCGIPQISRHLSYFIFDGENGKVIKGVRELMPAINFFLKDLNNWNKALVQNVQLLDEYSTEAVMSIWEGILNG